MFCVFVSSAINIFMLCIALFFYKMVFILLVKVFPNCCCMACFLSSIFILFVQIYHAIVLIVFFVYVTVWQLSRFSFLLFLIVIFFSKYVHHATVLNSFLLLYNVYSLLNSNTPYKYFKLIYFLFLMVLFL